MAQHFSLSASALTLNLTAIARMSDEEAHAVFVQIRWAETDGQPICPACECPKVYAFSTGRMWKCKECHRKFSATSSTKFHSRKKPIRDYLLMIAYFVNSPKGIAALELRRYLGVSYKTAFVLAHKLREIMGSQVQSVHQLEGEVEIDGTFFNAFERQANRVSPRRDRRNPLTSKDRAVVVGRERWGRTLPFVVPRETDGVPIFLRRIAEGSIVYADDARTWDRLFVRFPMLFRVTHREEAVSVDGASVNWCESFNLRLHRAEYGQHVHINGKYLQQYANETAWREDHRRNDNKLQWIQMISGALHSQKSRVWCGYWQRAPGDLSAIPGAQG
jgi:transposase-like protein